MKSLPTSLVIALVAIMMQTLGVTTDTFNQTHHEFHQPKSRTGKRNTKFIIPALISHMYRQKLEDSPLSNMLNKHARRVGKEDDGKRESIDHKLEHKIIAGNPKRDDHVRNVPKTKCPMVKTKLLPDAFEGKKRKNEKHGDVDRYSERGGNLIQVSKHFSPLSRNWYAGPPSVMWPPAVPYGMPLEQFSRPLYPGSLAYQPGLEQNIIGSAQNKGPANQLREEALNKLVAQERKFMVTNYTKYVLDFYCPHCGGEISVSKNRNKGNHFGADDGGAISINKGSRKESTGEGTTTHNSPTMNQQNE